jgi:hypothetical protein
MSSPWSHKTLTRWLAPAAPRALSCVEIIMQLPCGRCAGSPGPPSVCFPSGWAIQRLPRIAPWPSVPPVPRSTPLWCSGLASFRHRWPVLPGRFRACLPLFSDDQGMLAVVAVLEKLDSLSPAHGQWRLERQMSVNAYGSGQQFTAWIFRRSPSDKARALCTQ